MGIVCPKCNSSNRDIAKYCKFCGSKLVLPSFQLEDLVGLDDIKQRIQSIINIAQGMEKRRKIGQPVSKQNLHTVIIGNTGTGKSRIGEILCGVFYKYGITSKEDALTVDAVDWAKFTKDFEQNFQKAKGGILFIDNVQKLVPAGYSGEINPLDKLFSEMEKSKYDPIIILAGLPKGLKEYLEENPSIKGRFKYIFEIPDFNADQLFQIAENELKKQGFTLNEDANQRLKKLFKHLVKTKDDSFSNAREAIKQVEEIISNYYLRISAGANDDCIIIPEDIKGEFPEEKTVEEIFEELNELIGMENVKTEVRNLINTIRIQKERAEQLGETYKLGIHIVMTGNPGTGKTTVARKLGEIFQAIGLLDRGHLVEVDRSKMVAQYVGQTAPQVNKLCDSAMGGILFIDEAYTLAPENVVDSFGKEAIDTLLKRMEDDRGKFIVIVAGYPKEMQNFINANPGLPSRFNTYFHFEDYQPDELLGIFKKMAEKNKYEIEDKAEEKLKGIFTSMYERRDKTFANGREVRKLFEECIKMQANRLSALKDYDKKELSIIRVEDIPPKYEIEKVVSIEDALKKLEGLIGLQAVKREVKKLIDYLQVERARASAGIKETMLNLHFVFRGNPGTGKTTVARILADVFKAMGLLSKGHLVEVDRSGLVAEYVGQTAPKTNRVIDNAMGGILFIDEAYTLAPQKGGVGHDFGKEAIDTLLKRMEDDRGKFIVIVAGYPEPMEDFINANPGLQSRFTKYIDFEDYKPEELKAIFISMVEKKGMKLGEGVEEYLERLFTDIYNKRDRNFANARTVRNIFEMVLQNQSARVAELMQKAPVEPEVLNTITVEDLKMG
ncbi:MAG: AAA family ATPase [candidate division WOR-3 bacterium]